MSKYHVNPNSGEPGDCGADKGNCPFGGDSGIENHYDSAEEAQKASEKILDEKFGATKKLSRKERQAQQIRDKFGEYTEVLNDTSEGYEIPVPRISVDKEAGKRIFENAGSIIDGDFDVNNNWDYATESETAFSAHYFDNDISELDELEEEEFGGEVEEHSNGVYSYHGIAGEVADSVIASSKRFAPDSNLTKFIKTNKNARQLIADSVQFKESTRGDGSFTLEIPLLKGE